jgi:hypothetical protein
VYFTVENIIRKLEFNRNVECFKLSKDIPNYAHVFGVFYSEKINTCIFFEAGEASSILEPTIPLMKSTEKESFRSFIERVKKEYK